MSHDHRKHAGGGPEMLREYAEERVSRLTPSPEEARRAQEAANGYPRIMPEREATIRAQEALAARMYGQAQGVDQMHRAPGKRFSREAILAVIAAERTKWVPEPSEIGGARYRAAMQALDELQRIFENLE